MRVRSCFSQTQIKEMYIQKKNPIVVQPRKFSHAISFFLFHCHAHSLYSFYLFIYFFRYLCSRLYAPPKFFKLASSTMNYDFTLKLLNFIACFIKFFFNTRWSLVIHLFFSNIFQWLFKLLEVQLLLFFFFNLHFSGRETIL